MKESRRFMLYSPRHNPEKGLFESKDILLRFNSENTFIAYVTTVRGKTYTQENRVLSAEVFDNMVEDILKHGGEEVLS